MNSVVAIKNLKSAGLGFRFEDRVDIKPLGPPRPKLQIRKQDSVKGKTVSRNFNSDKQVCTNMQNCFVVVI
jgi:hypothetical protein